MMLYFQNLKNNLARKYSRFEAFLKLEMNDKEVVENNDDYAIEFKDKLKGKYHYSKKGEWIREKINSDPNKLCINNYALNNDPVFKAEISEKSIPEMIKLKHKLNPSYVSKFASYFPLWQLSQNSEKIQSSKSSANVSHSPKVSSAVTFPRLKIPAATREDRITYLHNRIRETKIIKLYNKLKHVFSLTKPENI